MKYTKYIIEGNLFNIDNIISNRRILKPITTGIAIPMACICILLCVGILPCAVAFDTPRYIKYQYIINSRKPSKLEQTAWVLVSKLNKWESSVYYSFKKQSLVPKFIIQEGLENIKQLKNTLHETFI